MRSIGLKVLKNKLSEYVRIAARGETVLITDRDQVVAELSPPRATRARTLGDAQLAELVRTGLLSPALNPAGPRLAAPERPARLADVLTELERDRADR